jgi:hypothetical protein
VVLPQPEPVIVPGRKIADVQRDPGELPRCAAATGSMSPSGRTLSHNEDYNSFRF